MSSQAWGYRPALDGLRTVAVYLVVLFHSGVAGVTGGFIGVDVFFVLSGFLVTNVLLAEHRSIGRVRIANFYARRVRRLLPAAVVTVVAVCALTVLVEPRLTRLSFIGDARSALLYFANWHFSNAATDYFADDVARSPFLHFWSLAIEEQFYLVFPVLLVGLLALARRARRPALVPAGLAALVSLSLALQLVMARTNALDAYYATPARLYQLLAGALLATSWRLVEREGGAMVRSARARHAGMLALVGVASIILVGTSALDVSASTRGVLATAVSVGVIAMLEIAPMSAVGRVLSTKPFTYLGRISYGTYLWHWPLIVLSRPVVDLRPYQMAIVAGVGATVLAALSFELIESPIRRAKALTPRPRSVVAVGLSMSAVSAALLVPLALESTRRPSFTQHQGLTAAAVSTTAVAEILGAAVPAELDLAATEPPPLDGEACGDDPDACVVHTGGRFHVMLLGDSNAIVLVPVFRELAERYDFTLSVATRAGCPWQADLVWNASDPALVDNCVDARAVWYSRILPALAPDLVVIAHVPRDEGSRDDGLVYEPVSGSLEGRPLTEAVAAATESTLDDLTANVSRVVLLEPLPYADFDPTECLSGADQLGDCAYEAPAAPFPTEATYRAEAERRTDVFSIDYDALACPYLPVCVPMIDGQLVFRNQFHLSNAWLMAHRDELWQLIVASGALDGV